MVVVVPSLLMGIVGRCAPPRVKTVAVHRLLGAVSIPLWHEGSTIHHRVGCIVGHVDRAREAVVHQLPLVGWVVGFQLPTLQSCEWLHSMCQERLQAIDSAHSAHVCSGQGRCCCPAWKLSFSFCGGICMVALNVWRT